MMGEARRRKLAGTYPTQQKREDKPDIVIKVLSDRDKNHIGSIMRSVILPPNPFGGDCMFRAICGFMGLRMIGRADIAFEMGGMLYRAGPEPVRDIVGFAGRDCSGFIQDGNLIGHVWLRQHHDIIDFSAGDWRASAMLSQELGTELAGSELAPTVWQFPPPAFFWEPFDGVTVKDETVTHTIAPPPGRPLYLPFRGEHHQAAALIYRAMEQARHDDSYRIALTHIVRQLRAAFVEPHQVTV